MNAVASSTLIRSAALLVAAIAAAGWSGAAAAADEDGSSLVERTTTAAVEPGAWREPRVTTERSFVPPGSTAAPLDATGRPYSEMSGVSVRWWARQGRSNFGLGLGVGTVGFVGTAIDGAVPLRSAMPTVTVGVRYAVSGETAVYADATSARELAANAAPGLYNTKVGMEWQPAKSRFGFEGRSLGIQLQSGYRMSLRVKSGGVGVYFRGKF
jgi:hypothetical protein